MMSLPAILIVTAATTIGAILELAAGWMCAALPMVTPRTQHQPHLPRRRNHHRRRHLWPTRKDGDRMTTTPGTELDARITQLDADNQRLRTLLNNGWLVVNDPANSFLSAEPWSTEVERELGHIQGCMRRARRISNR